MKKYLAVIPFMFLSIPSHAGFWDFITKPLQIELAAVKNDVKGDINGVKADVQKLADVSIKMQARVEAQAVALAGVNNSISSVRTSVGRDNTVTNDSALMKEYIQAIKDGAKDQMTLYKYVIGLLIIQLVGLIASLITLLSWIIKFLLRADKARDEREEAAQKRGK